MAFYRFCRWGGIRVCRRRNCASDSDLRIRCSSTFIADLFLWDRRGTYVSAQQVLDIQLAAPSAFAAYVAVQGVGFVCNLTIYTFALLVFHLPTASLPCPCVCRGPFFNYMGSKRLVFIKKMAEHLGQPQGERTSGKAWRAWPDVRFSSNTKVDEYASRPTIRAQQYSGETRERLTRLRTSSCRQCRSKRRPPPRPQSQISKALLLRRLDLQ